MKKRKFHSPDMEEAKTGVSRKSEHEGDKIATLKQ